MKMVAVEPPDCLKKSLFVGNKLLMGAGPSNCSPRVLQALSHQVMGHLQAETLELMDEIKQGMRYIFQTHNKLTLCVSGAGHAAMEAVMCNLLEPGEVVLIANNGVWGERSSNMASRYGASVRQIKAPAGDNFTLAAIEEGLVKYMPALLFIVQGESSTGCYQPLEGIGDLCHRYNCLLAVDTVASLGSVPVKMDEWGIDAIYTGSQKCLSAPPGITPMSFSGKAEQKIFSRKVPVAVYYLDMKYLGNYWNCYDEPVLYHHTGCTTLFCAFREALAIICEEGMENCIRRHQMCAQRLYKGLERLGLQPFIQDVHKRLPSITTVKVPNFINWKDASQYATKKYNFELAGGVGSTIGQVFRIGLMGYNATVENVDLALQILDDSVKYAASKSSKL